MQLKKEKVQDLISCLLFVEFMYESKKVQDIKRSQNVSLASINRQQKKSKGILHHIYSSKHFIKSRSHFMYEFYSCIVRDRAPLVLPYNKIQLSK
ncbi:hypothetical protein QL285_030277 [Trifolium repens]|nr:hypothetical protein QL285_030277 [Trifolium repens]